MAIYINILSKFDNKGFKKGQDALTKFANAAKIASAAAVGAVGAIGYQSVKAFASFDAQMTKSLAIMGDVSESLQKEMSDAAREVAKSTTFSADQAAESYFFLASAGLDATASIKAMPKVAAFAQAGMFDMALATDLLTDAQSALGMTIRDDAVKNMENMVRVSDVLVKANTLANASVEQFSTALTTKAGASLRALGKDVEEGVAVLAAFADQGIKGELAGTQLGIVLRDLTTKAIKNESAFKRMGVEVFDSNGEMNNMADIIGDLEGALDGMSDETAKATLLQMGFSDKSLASIMALLGTSEAIRQYEEDLREAGGTTETVADKQLGTLMAQLDLLKSKFIDMGIGIGASLEPVISGFVENMGPVLDELEPKLTEMFEALAPVLEELMGELPGLIEAMIPLIPIAGDLALIFLKLLGEVLPLIEELWNTISPAVDNLSSFMAENGEVVGALIVAFGLFRGVMLIATGAMGLFTGATIGATGASSGLFAMLRAHPFVALIAFGVGLAYTLESLADTAVKAKDPFAEFYVSVIEGAATTQEVFTLLWNGFIEGIKQFVFGLGGLRQAYNDLAGALKLPKLPEMRVPWVDALKAPTTTELRKYATRLRIEMDPGAYGSGSDAGTAPRTDIKFGPIMSRLQDLQTLSNNLSTYSGGGSYVADYYAGQAMQGPTNYNVYVNAGLGVNGNRLGEEITTIIERYQREAGPVFAAAR